MTAWTDLGRSQSARVKKLDAWWQSCAVLGLPDRSEFDPSAFANLLPYLLLSEAERPFRVRYRLIGTAIRDAAGSDFAGRYLDDMLPEGEEEEPWQAHYRAVFDTGRPLYGSCRILTSTGGHMDYEFGIWPLAHSGLGPRSTEIRQFIGIEDFGTWHGRVRPLREELADWQIALQGGAGEARPSRPFR
jgi:hypothetical protein